jgi:hypothetical protein
VKDREKCRRLLAYEFNPILPLVRIAGMRSQEQEINDFGPVRAFANNKDARRMPPGCKMIC